MLGDNGNDVIRYLIMLLNVKFSLKPFLASWTLIGGSIGSQVVETLGKPGAGR